MQYLFEDFRNALAILRTRSAFGELEAVLHALQPTAVLAEYETMSMERTSRGGRPPAGGQGAINRVLDRELARLGWTSQPYLFDDPALENWKMDFRKDLIGVEVSFNHAEAIPWQFTRLNIAGESDRVIDEHRIDVGVVVCAAPSLKRWARMDSAVGTFAQFSAWLREMRPILPTPLLLIGLEAEDWDSSGAFRGTSIGTRGGKKAVLELVEDDQLSLTDPA